jgi:hypothetical protein
VAPQYKTQEHIRKAEYFKKHAFLKQIIGVVSMEVKVVLRDCLEIL